MAPSTPAREPPAARTPNKAGRFERVHQIGDVARRAAQDLTQLSLRLLRLTLQLPEKFSPGACQAALRQTRVHACRQHHTKFEQALEYRRRLRSNSETTDIV